MKKAIILAICASFLLTGCSLIPKNVEFFQKKVKPVPEKTEKVLEYERQAAKYIDQKVEEAYVEAVRNDVTNTVVQPLKEAHVVAPALSTSLGPPQKAWTGTSTNLAVNLEKGVAHLNIKLEDYRERTEPLEGKKIEGTGLIQMSYFTYLLIILVAIWVIKMGLNIYGSINPAVGLGLNVAKVPVNVLKRGFAEVLEGGEKFKESLEAKIQDSAVKEQILELFKQSQLASQSRDTQTAVKDLTRK